MVNRKKEHKWSLTPGTFVLVLAVVFCFGYSAGTKNDQIASFVAPSFGLKVASGNLDLSDVQATYRTLKASYDGTLSNRSLIEGASRGLVAAAGDDYTIYMSQKEAEEFNKDLTGDIGGGIGAEIGNRNDKVTVIRTLEGTPARKSGLLPGDAILAVDGKSTSGWSVSDAVSKIRGDIDTPVKLTIQRGIEVKNYSIERARITAPSVESKIEKGIGILTLTRFDETTSDAARLAAQNFRKNNVKGVVLDLRGNGGGLLSSAQEVASIWLHDQVVVSEKTNGVTTDELRSSNNPVLDGIPTVVLVNGSSASASEIVAGALQDHKIATLVGEKTFGKGSVQKLVDLPGGAVLKVTIARWYTPNGKNINKEGISPDKKVTLDASDVVAGRDPQLDAAMSYFKM
ncbi:S41 family peptidase [Candidatus Saccharibacteria bacterium]|nr:S41 family peptidase [Candidatus Saccharibacteria bacterium]